jgi:hypothetical protein
MEQNMESQNPQTENQPQPESAAQPQTPPAGPIPQDSKNMAMLCHLLGLFTSFVGPLILWLIKKDEDKYVDAQGKEALNFQITVILASLAAGILSLLCIGFLVAIAVGISDIVFSILACVAASKGQDYRYPVSLRLIK